MLTTIRVHGVCITPHPDLMREALRSTKVVREIQSIGSYIAESAVVGYFREKFTKWGIAPYQSAYGSNQCRQFAVELKTAVESWSPAPVAAIPVNAVSAKCTRCGAEYMQDFFVLCGDCLSAYIDLRGGRVQKPVCVAA